VSTAQNGYEAFEQVKSTVDQGADHMFDLIILDLNMPISNGFDAAKKITTLFSQCKVYNHSSSDIGGRSSSFEPPGDQHSSELFS